MKCFSPTGILKLVGYAGGCTLLTDMGIDAGLFLATAIVIVFDVLTGAIKSVAIGGRKSFKSHTGLRGAFAKGLFLLTIGLMGYVFSEIGFNPEYIISALLSIYAVYELYSILANILSIRKKEHIEAESDAISLLIGALMNFMRKFLDEKIRGLDSKLNNNDK